MRSTADTNLNTANRAASYTFTRPRTIPFMILLIPLTILLLSLYQQSTLHTRPPVFLIAGMFGLFGLLGAALMIPKITIANQVLSKRNAFGYTGKPVNLVTLTSIREVQVYGLLLPFLAPTGTGLWLIDDNNNKISIAFGRWRNESVLKQLIANSPTGKNVAVNDRAAQFLGLM